MAARSQGIGTSSGGHVRNNMKKLFYKSWPDLTANIVDKGRHFYCTKLSIMVPRKTMSVPVLHLELTGGKANYVMYKEDVCVSGELIHVINGDSQLGRCIVSETNKDEKVN